MKRVGGRPEDTCRHDCGVFPPLPRSTGVLFLLLLTRWWILPSTAINPFYTAPLTCEIYLRTHILSQHTHWRVIAGAHTHTQRRSSLSYLFHFSARLSWLFRIHAPLERKHFAADICRNSLYAKTFRSAAWLHTLRVTSDLHQSHLRFLLGLTPHRSARLDWRPAQLPAVCLHKTILTAAAAVDKVVQKENSSLLFKWLYFENRGSGFI